MTEPEARTKLNDKKWRLNYLYKIQTKDSRLIKFKPNLVQGDYFNQKGQKNIILKARQMGFTTFCCIDMLDDTLLTPNTTSAIIAHTRDDASKLFEITKRAFNNLPDQLKPKVSYDNRNELYFADLDSKIYVDTDLRGGTTHNLHISETAFIEGAEKKMAGILETVPANGRITLESTANGASGYFYDEWDNTRSEFKKHFYNWFWDENYQLETDLTVDELKAEYQEYVLKYSLIPDLYEKFNLTKEQFYFYITKIRRLKHLVVQEYPTTPLEAFISSGRNVFHISDLQKHEAINPIDQKWDMFIWEKPLEGFRYVIGCDVAEGLGGDYSVIEVFNVETGFQAAEYVSNSIAPDDLADYLYDIGKMYNNAFINVEVNNHGRSTIDALKKRYYNLYRRKVFDKVTNRETEAIGWRTTATTKPLLVDNLEEAIRDQSFKINSERTIKEMKVFVQTNEPGKSGFGAEEGKNDDCIIACGLALQAIKSLPKSKKPRTIAQIKLQEYLDKYKLPITREEISRKKRPHYIMRRTIYGKA